MGYNDFDDEFKYDEDDFEDDYDYDDDDDSGPSISGRIDRGKSFSGLGDFDDDEDDDDDDESIRGTGLPGSSGSRFGVSAFSTTNKPSYSSGPRPPVDRRDLDSKMGAQRSPTSGSDFRSGRRDDNDSRSTSSSSSPFNRGSGSMSPSRPASSSSSSSSSSPFSRQSSSGYGSSSVSSSSPSKPTPTSPAKDDKKDDKKDSGGGFLSRAKNAIPFGGGGDDKKDDKKDSGGSVLNRAKFGGSGGDKKDTDSGGGRFSNLRNRVTSALPVGGSGGDKKDDKKESGASLPGKIGGALPSFGRGGDKKDDKPTPGKPDKKESGGSPLGRLTSRLPFGGKKDDKPDDKKVSYSTTSKGQSSLGGAKSGGGDSTTIGQRFKNVFGGNLFKGKERPAKPARPKKQTTPTVADDTGLTLDNWLDIAGVALVFGSLVLFFSAISAEQAAIRGLHTFFGQLFGWGALAVPGGMFIVGMWLIVRHFGEDAPTVDPVRVVGAILVFISLLVVFQYIDSFSYNLGEDGVITQQLLEARVRYSWEALQEGGGAIGSAIYMALLVNVTEVGGFFVILFTLIIGTMLITRLSASELVAFFVSMWRSLRDMMRQRADTRRAERQLMMQAQLEMQNRPPDISVSKPEPAQLGDGTQRALPEPSALALSSREIRFNRGGETVTANAESAQPQYTAARPAQPAQNGSSGGLFGIFKRNNQQTDTSGGIGSLAGGLLGMLGTGDDQQQVSNPQSIPLPENPLPMDDDAYTPPTAAPQPTARVTPPTQPPSTAASTPEPQAAASTPPPTEQAEPPSDVYSALEQRQQRLDALRKGEIGPLSGTPRAGASMPQTAKPATPTNGNGYKPFGPPEDRITHESEKLPYTDAQRPTAPSKLPSAQPVSDEAPYQEPLNVPPAINPDHPKPAPQSTPVQRQTARAQWKLPDFRTLLSSGSEQEFDREALLRQAKIIEDTLEAFGAPGRVVEVNTGPVITQFGVEPAYMTGRNGKQQRVKVGSIASLDKDLQLALGARSIRVEAPVPGKGYVGIEVPNAESTLVSLRDVMEDASFRKHKSPLGIALGQSVSGQPISADLANMPHLLIAGTTGSGKSVCVNAIITSIIARNSPEVVKFIMVDPKRVELTGYNGIPHLVAPVVVELERIVGVLKWVTREMDDRYRKFSNAGARNIIDFNNHLPPEEEIMPYIIVIIDELADLMMLAPEETERTITRIAALARATGIHLVIATQRPSVDVVTGLIKANFPARIAFAVAGSVDSRVILDQPGAERLLGKGDMLYLSGDSPAALRLQGVYVSDIEITNIVRYWKMQAVNQPSPKPITMMSQVVTSPDDEAMEVKPRGERVKQAAFWESNAPTTDDSDFGSDVELDEAALTGDDGTDDELYEEAVALVRKLDKASISLLQRRLRIGYTRAARMIDVMEARGVVGPAKDGSSKPRDVLPAS